MSYISQTNMVTLFSSDKDDTLYGTDNSEILRGGKGHDLIDATTDTTPIYTPQSNNNYYKQKIFTSNLEIDTINNCFYMFNKKVA